MNYLNIKLNIKYDKTKPDGTFQKLLDNQLAKKYGWKAKTSLKEGIGIAINDYIKNSIKKDFF